MSGQPWYREMMAGGGGALATPVRGALRIAALAYGWGVARRNARFDRPCYVQRIPIPVISVGNLTVGGTGKTPLVIDLVQRLHNMGKNPVVLARGYRSGQDDINDEQRLIQSRCPGVHYVADPDRVAAGREAIARGGADCAVLDDGFQHRRLGRDLDIVLVDATNPFGYGHLLPRGLMREPVSSLKRADLIILTRCDQAAASEIDAARTRIHASAPGVQVLRCRHHPVSLHRLDGSAVPLDFGGKRVGLFAGVANPRSFAATVSNLGATVVDTHWWPDHHRYTARGLVELSRNVKLSTVDTLVITEKDAVKLAAIPEAGVLPILVLRIAVAFEEDGSVVLQQKLEETLRVGAAKP